MVARSASTSSGARCEWGGDGGVGGEFVDRAQRHTVTYLRHSEDKRVEAHVGVARADDFDQPLELGPKLLGGVVRLGVPQARAGHGG